VPLVIALTGGIGSGKSRVADFLEEFGAAVIDTDAIAHRLTASGEPGAVQIGAQFGPEYLGPDGALDRKRMRDLVFADPASRKKLESILHPMIRAEVGAAVHAAQAPYIVLVVPLLVETGAYRDLARRVLVVDCSESEQIRRVRARNGLSDETIRGIMASQASRAERLARADDVICNDADIETLKQRSAEAHKRYLSLAAAAGTVPGDSERPKKPH
jgi:dephospho-CoA kinase